jgi:hypothetical protein
LPSSTLRETAADASRSSEQWNGTLTLSFSALRGGASATIWSIAAIAPETTICSGSLTLAISQTPASTLATSAFTSSRPILRSTTMPPVPTGTALCMRRARSRTRRTASANANVPAATCAEYSPRLWPAASVRRDAERPERRDRDRQRRRLRVLGQPELVLGAR